RCCFDESRQNTKRKKRECGKEQPPLLPLRRFARASPPEYKTEKAVMKLRNLEINT
ncbi:hypothetical protein L9F63_022579, partial [Diploptera punctata]